MFIGKWDSPFARGRCDHREPLVSFTHCTDGEIETWRGKSLVQSHTIHIPIVQAVRVQSLIGGTPYQAVQREHGSCWPWISMQMVDIISSMSFAFSTYLFKVYMTYHFSAFGSNTCLCKLCRNYTYSVAVSRKVRTYFVDVQNHWTRGWPSY